jgi:dienelactone hydrolase
VRNRLSTDRLVYPLPPDAAIERTRDLAYRAADPAARFDVYRPVNAQQPPVVAFVHGDTADPERLRDVKDWGQFISWGELCAANGLAAITFNHRSSHRRTRMSDVRDDIEAMLDHVDVNGELLGLDTSRVALFSISMGVPYGICVAFGRRARLRCAVAFYGPLDLSKLEPQGESPSSASSLEEFSPIHHLLSGRELPPLFVARAGRDHAALNESIDSVVREALARNLQLDVLNHPDGPHAFDVRDPSSRSRDIIRGALQFLQAHLGRATAG